MSENIDTIRADLWEKMRNRPYRETFVAAHLSTNIVAQIQTLREQRGWSKKHLAEKTGMAPSRISVMEDPSYEKFTLSTLRRLASAFDVALIARFVPFSELVEWVVDLSPEKMGAVEFERDGIPHQNLEEVERPVFQVEQQKAVSLTEQGSTALMGQEHQRAPARLGLGARSQGEPSSWVSYREPAPVGQAQL